MADDRKSLSLRLFFAVELSREVREAAAAHVSRLRRDFPGARVSWPRPENLHLTLKFLGEVEATRVDSLWEAAAVAGAGVGPFSLTIEGTGTFPTHGLARVLWLGVRDGSDQLARLQFRLDKECAQAGFPRESKPFKPHLTLARLRALQRPEIVAALSETHRGTPFGPHAFQVTDFVLMRSELGPGGSRYTPLSHQRFDDAP
jgi:2'-5' RNA ligase